MKRTELQRGTPLQRTGIKRSSGPVKPRKPAVLKRHPGPQSAEEKAGRKLMGKRSGGRCEVAVPGVCIGFAAVWSHRKRRGQSGKAEKWCVSNGLHGCGPCELYLTDHGSDPKVRSQGWTIYPSPRIKPHRVPAWRWGEYVWLTPLGRAVPLDFSELAEWIGGAA